MFITPVKYAFEPNLNKYENEKQQATLIRIKHPIRNATVHKTILFKSFHATSIILKILFFFNSVYYYSKN